MSVDVGVATVIERPIAIVAAYASDAANLPEWSRLVDSAEWRTEPPTRLGSRIMLHTRLVGRTRDVLFEIYEWTPGEQIALRPVADPMPITLTLAWRPVGDRVTHMTVRLHGEPRGMRRLLTPLIARRMRRAATADLAELTRRLERTA